MTQPHRIQMSRKHPWRAENPGAVIVARPSRWGNPFRALGGTVYGQNWHNIVANFGLGVIAIDECAYITCGNPEGPAASHRDAVVGSISRFRRLCEVMLREQPKRFREWIAPLEGKDLACWCPPDQPCHADVLLEFANPETTP